jgi:hypothetical protein
MDNFRATAIYLTFWYAFLALLSALLVIALNDLDARAALLAAADVALLFALGLIVKSRGLSEHSIMRGEFWRALPASERPRGERGRRMAYSVLERVWLHAAKGAAAIAIVLCALALLSNHTDTSASAQNLPVVSDND